MHDLNVMDGVEKKWMKNGELQFAIRFFKKRNARGRNKTSKSKMVARIMSPDEYAEYEAKKLTERAGQG